jgi:hypothetical protein
LALVAALGLIGLGRLRRDPVVLITLAAWLAGGTLGVLGGGSYWPHYLIELIPVTCVAAAAGVAACRPPAQVVLLGACAAVALFAAGGGIAHLARHPPHQRALAVARYVRGHARPGDTQYVMYAQANVDDYTGLPDPYPYAWSLMVRAKPGAIGQLQRLLRSSRRPTWLVEFQRPSRWGLDPRGVTRRLIARHYRLAAIVRGQRVYLRSDRRR